MSYEESYKLYCQAKELISKKDFASAIPLLKKSNRLHTHFKTLEHWGNCEIKLGNYQRAIMPLTAATELNNHIKPKSLLALAYSKIGNKNKAIELAQNVVTMSPDNKIANNILDAVKTVD